MNNPIKYLYLIPAGIVICTILSVISSCSEDDNPPGDTLPAGKYPMTFTTSVGELVVTRGTADNSQWAGTEEVAIQLGNDAANYGEIKEYKAAIGGELTPADNVPLYWRNTTETVTAWYPYSIERPTTFTVQADQNTEPNYQTSDFLYTTGTHTYKSSDACALVFNHLSAKVVINLKGDGNGITDSEIANAKVSIINQSLTSGQIGGNGKVTAADAGTAAVTPKKLASATTGYQQTVQALLVPQVVRNKKFIEVTIGENDDARHYYYTPTEVAFDSGTQYTYNITVKREELEVTTEANGSWTNVADDTDAPEATFNIYLAELKTGTGITTAKVTDGNNNVLTATNGVYTTSSKTVKIVYTVNNDYDLWNFTPEVKEGFCTPQGVTANGNDYTYTLTDICTDVWLSNIEPTTQPKKVNVGDYYYSDGTWSTDYKTDKTCIGIVFYAGVGTGDQASNYGGTIASTKIHGYVVALKDAHASPGAWGTRLVDENKAGRNSRSTTDYDGYSNTTHIRNIGDDYNNTDVSQPLKNSQYWAFKVASVYQPVSSITPAAPTSSSGWYLPSYAQINAVCRLNMDTQLTATGGTKLSAHTGNYRYWSSTEYSEFNAYYYSSYTDTDHKNQYAKSNDLNEVEQKDPSRYNYLNDSKSYVRAILTF